MDPGAAVSGAAGLASVSSSTTDEDEFASADECASDWNGSDCDSPKATPFSPGGFRQHPPRLGPPHSTPADSHSVGACSPGNAPKHDEGSSPPLLRDRQPSKFSPNLTPPASELDSVEETIDGVDVDPQTARNLDGGDDVLLCKVYYINDSVSGTEWVVDGFVEPGASVAAIWGEKRVKNSETGSIISLAELEEQLVTRVMAQFDEHKVKDLDSGVEVDLFSGVPKSSVTDSIRKDLRVEDRETGEMLSLSELQERLVLALPMVARRKGKSRLPRLKGKHVKRFASKVVSGFQALKDGDARGQNTSSLRQSAGNQMRQDEHSVRVQVQKKQFQELSALNLIQKIAAHKGLIWAMQFSPDGLYLASGGQDKVILVWEVVPLERRLTTNIPTHAPDVSPSNGRMERSPGSRQSRAETPICDIARPRPCRRFAGHGADVLDVAWSSSGFLLSSSMDKTVRLWHVSVDGECLRTFNHTDFVTCVQFHPTNDKVFMSGSIDGKVRLWNIPQIRVLSFAECHQMVTAASFSPDGEQVAVGTMSGKCRFYNHRNSKLNYEAQLDVCTAKGRNRKITGIQYMPTDKTKVLITSNDSRLRLYSTTEYQQRCKYKGLVNRNAQIRGSFSSNGKYILCGSDQGQVFVWSTVNPLIPAVNPSYTAFRKDKNSSFETFQPLTDIVTVALFAPETWHNTLERTSPLPGFTKAASALLRVDTSVVDGEQPPAAESPPGRVEVSQGNDPPSMFGQVIVAAGHTGEICIFENTGHPQWL